MQWLIVSFVGISLTSFLLVAQTLSCVAEHIKDEATMEMKPILQVATDGRDSSSASPLSVVMHHTCFVCPDPSLL